MRRASIILFFVLTLGAVCNGQSLTVFRSSWSISETVRRVENNLYSHPVNKLDAWDASNHIHSDSSLRDSVVVLAFNDPLLTGDLLDCEPTAALDLPLKILVWGENGDVYLGFMDPYFMKRRFLIRDCDDTIDKMTKLLLRVINDTIKSN